MSITTVDNFNSSFCNDSTQIKKYGFKFALDGNNKYLFISTTSVNNIQITLKTYKEHQNTLFSVIEKENKKDDDLILSVSSHVDGSGNKIYTIQTGNYIGRFTWSDGNNNGLEIDIKSRFSDVFLKRMLNFANDIYLDTSVFEARRNEQKSINYSKFIIYYMFIQKLEKAFLLGIPKAYKSIRHHEMKLKGKIDINRFIKYDIPFKGKVSSVSREQKEIQEIIDILYKAITIIEKDENKFSFKNVGHIKTHLRQNKSNRHVSNETILKAVKTKALENPIFSPYKKVLEYAKLIIDANNLEEKKDADKETFGFLVNVAELFEVYLVKLLQYKMPDWDVLHEEPLDVYRDNFFRRNMYPDIVMKKDNKVMVFDAKYKKMIFRDRYQGADLDRNDFFQINTYMTYYDKQGYEVKAGGLLYPIESNIELTEQAAEKKAHTDNWFGDDKTQFIVDGIDLSKDNLSMDDILESENAFIKRIQKISENIK